MPDLDDYDPDFVAGDEDENDTTMKDGKQKKDSSSKQPKRSKDDGDFDDSSESERDDNSEDDVDALVKEAQSIIGTKIDKRQKNDHSLGNSERKSKRSETTDDDDDDDDDEENSIMEMETDRNNSTKNAEKVSTALP